MKATAPQSAESSFTFAGEKFTAIMDNRAIAVFERESDQSIVAALEHIRQCEQQKIPPKISILAYMIMAAVNRHHPEVDYDKAMEMVLDEAVQAALGTATSAAMPKPKAGDGPFPEKKARRKRGTGKA
jgi:hypothetical protein